MISTLVLLFSALLTSQANARPSVNSWPTNKLTITCKPETKIYPFDQFTLTLDKAKSKMDLTFSKDSGYWEADNNPNIYITTDKKDFSKNLSQGILKIESIETEEDSTDNEVLSVVVKLYADFNDWAAVNVELRSDDEGHGAFVHFFSDGPSILSLYRCELK